MLRFSNNDAYEEEYDTVSSFRRFFYAGVLFIAAGCICLKPAVEAGPLPQDSLARDSIMRELGRLVIAQTDTALTFTVGRAAPLTVFTDWRETRIPGRYGPWDVTFVTGQWHGTRFEVRRVLPSHTVIVESYALSRNGRQLTVTTRIAEKSDEGGEILPREGRRVYDRVMAPPATGDSTP